VANPSSQTYEPSSQLIDCHWVDFVLAHVNPLWSVVATKARLLEVRRESPDASTFVLQPNSRWRGFRPGQFVPLRVRIEGVVHQRCYSLTGAASTTTLELTIKRRPGGVVSSFLHDRLRVGAIVELGPAQGDFVLPEVLPRKLLLVAGGIGITPLYSLMRDALARDRTTDLALLYYAHGERDFVFRPALDALAGLSPALRIDYVTSGRSHAPCEATTLARIVPDWRERLAYACGPEPLLEAVGATFAAADRSARLRVERFGRTAATTGGTAHTVTYARSGVVCVAAASTLLEAAECAGLRPAYGCRMGICRTCRCRKIDGPVRDLSTGAVDDAPGSDIRLCVTEPVGPVTLDL
jgi:ferredoxin-NADP reductase